MSIPFKFAQSGVDSMEVESQEEGMAFETQRTGHVKLTSYGLDVKRWNICMKTCP